jgi:hypothetical protein
MSPQDIEKLLGGYATDTLNDQERRTLFEAALGNQALFDALADEQALRELLQDGPSRAHLLAALGGERVSPLARLAAWLRRPPVLALAAAVAAGIVTVAVVIPRRTVLERPATVAMNKPPQPEQVQVQPQVEAQKQALKQAASAKGPETKRVIERLERDALTAQNAPAAPPPPAKPTPPAEPAAVSAAAPPPPPPAPAMVLPALPQSAATMEIQAAKAKLADTIPAGAAGDRLENRKEAVAPGARDLYYAMQPAAVGGFLGRSKADKTRQRSFGASGVVGGVPTAVMPRAGGVRYSILKGNPDGSFAEVEPATIFAVGDALRVRFETNQAGNLGVMERQASGLWTLRMGARMQQGEPVQMPSESTIHVTAPGSIRFFVRFSRTLRSEPSLDSITPTAGLLRENAANSMYVVNPAWIPDAAVDFELTINAK